MKLNKDIKRWLMFIAVLVFSGAAWIANLIGTNSSVIYRHEVLGRYFDLFSEKVFNAFRVSCSSSNGWEF